MSGLFCGTCAGTGRVRRVGMHGLAVSEVCSDCSAPYQPHSETSRAAARSVKDNLGPQAAAVLAILKEKGPMTDEQMQERLGMSPNSQRPRRVSLAERGLVEQAGEATTRSGRRAVRWKAVDV